jgi:hypothetical protein
VNMSEFGEDIIAIAEVPSIPAKPLCTVGGNIMSGDITRCSNLQPSKQRLTLILYIMSWPLVAGTSQRHHLYSSHASDIVLFGL